jgi:hypothetical protein
MITVVLTGLFLARPAQAAAASPAQASHTTQTTRAAQPAQPSGGVCSVPGIGDIGGLLGFCSSGSGTIGDLNNICTPALQQPEQATSGIDSMIAPPQSGSAVPAGGKTLYDNYGMAGQYWAAYGLQCSDMTSLIGNNVAGMVFDAAKSLDRVTITVYESAAGNGILSWLQSSVNMLITALGNAIFFPYLAVVVIIGAMWLAWQGLFRKRATRTIEGTAWMVIACVAALWLIGRPGDFTGLGANVSNGVTQVLNVAFSKLPAPGGSNCLPVSNGDQQSVSPGYAFTSANGVVDQNANELWSVLVCKPWLNGELGTSVYATSPTGTQTVVNQYGRQLLWAQAIAVNEQPTQAIMSAKQNTYVGIAKALQQNNPAVYPLFQGNQWTTRLEIAFAALFAAIAAGLLVLLISITLIVLKLGWLLLLVAGPFFLIVGIHPGFGRVVAMRWFEMLIGVLLKQVAVALVLSVLLYCYSLIMGTTDAALPWALKILMIALVTVAVWIYRKPFTHLFSSVGYGMIGSSERAEYSYREASTSFRRATSTAAGVLPGVGAYRAARWARRNQVPDSATGTAAGAAGAAAAGAQAPATGGAAGAAAEGSGYSSRSGARLRSDGTAVQSDGAAGGESGGSGGPAGSGTGGSAGAAARGPRHSGAGSAASGASGGSGASGASGRAAPPLPLSKPSQQSGASGSRPGTGSRPGGGASRSTSSARSAGSASPTRSTGTTGSAGSSSAGSSGSGGASSWARNTAGWSGAGRTETGSSPANRPAPPPTPSAGTSQGKTSGSSSSGSSTGGSSTGGSSTDGTGTSGTPSPARFWQRRK